jgi:Ubiquitin-conjugating enzyme
MLTLPCKLLCSTALCACCSQCQYHNTQNLVYHPNINLQGNVCLNILREDWKPVLDINAVIYGLIYLFYEPNPGEFVLCVTRPL